MAESAWSFVRLYKTMFVCGALCYFAGVAVLYRQLPERAQHFDIDSGGYHSVALRKMTTGVFELNNKPLLHPLGYSAFLVILYSIVGDSVAWVVAIQALFAFLSVMAITLLAFRWYGHRTAVCAFFLALANVGFYIFPQVLLVEVLQLFCIAWAWERLVRFLQTNHNGTLAVSGFLAGLSLLLKPSALHFPFLVVIALLLFASHKREFFKKYAVSIVIFLVAFYTPVVAIMMRNWMLWGYFKFSYLLEENLFNYFYHQLLVALYGYTDAGAWAHLEPLLDRSYLPFGAGFWQGRKHTLMYILFTHWDQVLLVCIQNGIKNCFGFYTRMLAALVDPGLQMQLVSFFKNTPTLTTLKQYVLMKNLVVTGVALYEMFYSAVRWGLVGFGLFSVKRDMLFWLTLLSSLYFLGALCMYGNGRYRFIQEPLLLVFAAQALQLLLLRLQVPKHIFMRRKIA